MKENVNILSCLSHGSVKSSSTFCRIFHIFTLHCVYVTIIHLSFSTVGRSAVDAEADSPDGKRRLQRLCDFQTKALDHALGFPKVRRVVYSTCSVHREENEDVVFACLQRHCDEFELEQVLPQWHRRGEPHFDTAEM